MGNVACDDYVDITEMGGAPTYLLLSTAEKLTEEQLADLKEKWYNMQKGVVIKISSGLYVSTNTITGKLSDEEQFYQDMRDAIRELEEEERKINEAKWEEWFRSHTIGGLY